MNNETINNINNYITNEYTSIDKIKYGWEHNRLIDNIKLLLKKYPILEQQDRVFFIDELNIDGMIYDSIIVYHLCLVDNNGNYYYFSDLDNDDLTKIEAHLTNKKSSTINKHHYDKITEGYILGYISNNDIPFNCITKEILLDISSNIFKLVSNRYIKDAVYAYNNMFKKYKNKIDYCNTNFNTYEQYCITYKNYKNIPIGSVCLGYELYLQTINKLYKLSAADCMMWHHNYKTHIENISNLISNINN